MAGMARPSSGPRISLPPSTRALASGLPAVIELRLDPEALSTGQTLTQARAAGLARA